MKATKVDDIVIFECSALEAEALLAILGACGPDFDTARKIRKAMDQPHGSYASAALDLSLAGMYRSIVDDVKGK